MSLDFKPNTRLQTQRPRITASERIDPIFGIAVHDYTLRHLGFNPSSQTPL